jgi:hypothetical protein
MVVPGSRPTLCINQFIKEELSIVCSSHGVLEVFDITPPSLLAFSQGQGVAGVTHSYAPHAE